MGDSAAKYGSAKRDSTARVVPQRKKSTQELAKERKARVFGGFHLARRLLVLAAATWYIYVSVEAATRSMIVMRGIIGESMPAQPYVSELIPHYVGESTIRMSPLVVDVLGNSTAIRNDSGIS